ncbi:MAG: hypothetical protein R2726_01445 [Acidimicrobiales bacterium]
MSADDVPRSSRPGLRDRVLALPAGTRMLLALAGLILGVVLILFGTGVLDREVSSSTTPTTQGP